MNKRQKKKNVKRALERLGNGKLTKKDKQILFTYGRAAFKAKYSLEPEIIDAMPLLIEKATNVLDSIKKAIARVFINLGDAFSNIGKTLQRGIDSVEQNSDTIAINDIEPIHTSKPGEHVRRGAQQKERDLDLSRLHLPSYTRRV